MKFFIPCLTSSERRLANGSVLAMVAPALLLTGCDTLNTPAPAPARASSVNYAFPVVQPVEPTKQEQEKDGIRISVAAYPFTVGQRVSRDYRRVPSAFVANDQYPAQIREASYPVVEPRQVRLKVKINNQLERVLRLAGTVVVFQVAGKTMTVDKTGYESFLSGIILPRQEQEYDITGPAVDTLQDTTTLAFLLYDIVTATDPAGNPIKRSNFEWYFQVTKETRSAEAPVTVRSIYLNRDAAAELLQRERSVGAWVPLPTGR